MMNLCTIFMGVDLKSDKGIRRKKILSSNIDILIYIPFNQKFYAEQEFV